MRNILGCALAGLLLAGCKTAPVETVAVTEVALPEHKAPVLAAGNVDTNNMVMTPPPEPLPAPTRTNAPAPPKFIPPANGWLPLEQWSAVNCLGHPQKLGGGDYSVATRTGSLVLRPGSQAARWDGIQVWLGLAPRFVGGKLHVHWLDVQKTLEPLLDLPSAALKRKGTVVIDAGHGGSDGGTQGGKNLLEKTFTLDWALRVGALLQTNGWQVFLTRTNDVDLPLTNRVAFADKVGADLFVSLHFNGLTAQATHSGIETFCLTPAGMPSSVTRGYEDVASLAHPNNAHDVQNFQYAYRVHRALLAATRAADGGVRRARFMRVLREQSRPAVLVEGGFLTNSEEARRIATPAYRQKLAEAVVKALEEPGS